MKLSKEIKTGLFAIFAILTFVLGYNFIKGTSLFKTERIFYAVFEDIDGLNQSSAVTINGLQVGRVKSISLDPKTANLIVSFSVENNFNFTKQSTAKLYSSSLIGGKSIAIVPDFESTLMAKSGDTLSSKIEEGIMDMVTQRLFPLQEKIESVLVGVDSMVVALNQILDTNTQQHLKNTISNFNQISTSFASSSSHIEQLLNTNKAKLNNSFSNLDTATTNFASLSDSLAQINLSAMVNDIELTLNNFKQISENLNDGEGSIGKLLNDPTLYKNLEHATRQLEELLQDLKLNPRRYINLSLFGRKNIPYQRPENRTD